MSYKLMEDTQFKSLQAKVNKDLTITPDNVMQKSLDLSKLYTEYSRRYYTQVSILKNINIEKVKLYKKLYHHYKFDGDFRLDTKKEIEVYVLGDDLYCELRRDYEKQTIIVEFLEKTLSNIQRASFTIRDYIELQKFKKGVV